MTPEDRVTRRAADTGHTFRIVVTSRMSSMVVGDEHHEDAPEFGSTALVLKVRAWDLPSALRSAAEHPLSDWAHVEWGRRRWREAVPRPVLRILDHGGGFGLGASVAWLIRGALDGDPVAIVGSILIAMLCVVVGAAAMTERERRGDL